MEKGIYYETPVFSLRRLVEHDNSDNFTIYIKINNNISNKIEINTSSNKARVISNNINNICLIDPTINQYEINYKTISEEPSKIQGKLINVIHKIINSIEKQVLIDEEDQKYFYQLLILFGEKRKGNGEELQINISSINEAISLLSTEFHDISVKYLSSRLNEFFSKSYARSINDDVINEIIDTFFLEHYNEQEETNLGELFEQLIEEGDESVIFHFLMKLKAEEMNEKMVDYIYDHLDDEIVKDEFSQIISMIRRHYLSILKEKTNSKPQKRQPKDDQKSNKKPEIEAVVEYEGNRLNGIFSYLQRTYGENIGQRNNVLKISAGGSTDSKFPPTDLIKYNSNGINKHFFNYFGSIRAKENEGWIEFDFNQRKVNLTSYTIRSKDGGPDWNHPKSWRIEGSNDKENWVVIDSQTNDSSLRGDYKIHHFDCSNNENNYYKYIRYFQVDNWNKNKSVRYNIYLTCIELFGSISKPQ